MKVAIEGAPGVGKSTLCRALAAHVPDTTWVEEPVTDNPYLADYYGDPRRWALAMQVDILLRRANAIAAVAHRRHAVEFLDRSAWGDRLFAHTAKSLGLMEPREFDTYDSVFRTVSASAGAMPDVVVYLQASPDALWARVAARARPAEAGMTRAYLDAVCASYEAFFTNPPFGMRVAIVDWETFGTAEVAWAAVEAAFSRGSRQ
jgi:deoxyadenosine/deoxycytidine kinase